MATALFLSLPLDGHINPSLPVVRELAERGETVIYYASDRFATQIESAGAQYRPYDDPFLADLSQLPAQTHELSWLLMRTAASVLHSRLDDFRDVSADYILADSVAPWGQWAGRILKTPVVTSVSTFAINRHVLAFAVARGIRPKSARLLLSKLRCMANARALQRRLCRTYGVRGPGVLESAMGHSGLNIVYTSRQFQPCAPTFDESFVFVGPMMRRTETGSVPWESVRHPDIVYVSLGTIFNTDVSFFQRCFDAFADQNYSVIVSIGRHIAPESLGIAPPNVLVQTHVPQLAVLSRARAFVTHGGMNSVNESLASGVPMLVIPQMSEQAVVGRQVERLGAGLYLAKEAVTAQRLHDSVQRLLTDDQFRRAAAQLRQSFQSAGGPALAADKIHAFTR